MEGLTVEARGPIRLITLDRRGKGNAINGALHSALATVWDEVERDSEARAVVLTGAGTNFTVGGDFEWMLELHRDERALRQSIKDGADIVHRMISFRLPVVAALNGAVTGLGCSLAVLSDFSLIADDAVMRDPHVAVGLVAGDGGAAIWPAQTSVLAAKRFLLTGDPITAPLAVQLGLATEVVPAAELMERAFELAGRVAALPPLAVQSTKRALNMHLARAADGVLDFAFQAEAETLHSEDHRRIVAAMVKRFGAEPSVTRERS